MSGQLAGFGDGVYDRGMDTREAAQRWADVWERGWREHDAVGITALYAEGAFWKQHPFRDPEPDYLARVFAEEESAQCQFGTPIVDGDQAAVPWNAQARLADGGTENLAGVSLLRFSDDGLVLEERDFWNQSLLLPSGNCSAMAVRSPRGKRVRYRAQRRCILCKLACRSLHRAWPTGADG